MIVYGFSGTRAGAVWKLSEQGLQPEDVEVEQTEISASAASQIEKLGPEQLAIWISAAGAAADSALALFIWMNLIRLNCCRSAN